MFYIAVRVLREVDALVYKKSVVKSREFLKIIIFCLLSRHQTESKRTESA